jgi:hypothetical protein
MLKISRTRSRLRFAQRCARWAPPALATTSWSHAAVVDAGAAEMLALSAIYLQVRIKGVPRKGPAWPLPTTDVSWYVPMASPSCSAQSARTVKVIEATTAEAIANCACRSLMPCRRAIQSKSV